MRPVLTVDEMRQVDADALKLVSEAVLVERAGTAVATWALRLLGGSYGRRVVVVAGKGNNGADGRVAAERLRAPRGAGGRRRSGRRPRTARRRTPLRSGRRRRVRHGIQGFVQRPFGAGRRASSRRRHSVWDRRRHGGGLGRGLARRPHRDLRRAQAGPAPRRRPCSLRTSRGRRHRPRSEPCAHLARRRRRRPPAAAGQAPRGP